MRVTLEPLLSVMLDNIAPHDSKFPFNCVALFASFRDLNLFFVVNPFSNSRGLPTAILGRRFLRQINQSTNIINQKFH